MLSSPTLARFLNYGQPVDWKAPLNRNLLAWYRVLPGRLGGTRWIDLTGLNPGSMQNFGAPSATSGFGPTTRVGGYGEVRFDGSDDYVSVIDSHRLDLTGVPLTIMAWVYPTDLSASPMILSKVDSSGDTNGYEFWIHNFGLVFYRVDNSVGGNESSTNSSITTNAWWQVAVTQDGSRTRFYINGVKDNDVGFSARPSASTNDLWIGQAHPSGQLFAGSIDNIRLFDRVVTDDEMIAQYQAGLTGNVNELNWNNPLIVFSPAAAGASPSFLTLLGVG